MERLTPIRIRKIRKALGFSKGEFARTLWAAVATVERWESGDMRPAGMHHRFLVLLERALANPSFRPALRDPRASDPMFLLYRLLEPLYEGHSAKGD
jgi:transcriptional regulator with XRE-family HTH domain